MRRFPICLDALLHSLVLLAQLPPNQSATPPNRAPVHSVSCPVWATWLVAYDHAENLRNHKNRLVNGKNKATLRSLGAVVA